MAKYQFKYYLHDDYNSSELKDFLKDPKYGNLPKKIAKEIAESRPFYEVTLQCEYDTETGTIVILEATP